MESLKLIKSPSYGPCGGCYYHQKGITFDCKHPNFSHKIAVDQPSDFFIDLGCMKETSEGLVDYIFVKSLSKILKDL